MGPFPSLGTRTQSGRENGFSLASNLDKPVDSGIADEFGCDRVVEATHEAMTDTG